MKVTCKKENLLYAINTVQKGVSTKTTLPILEGILIKAEAGLLIMTSNDLEIGIECKISAEVEKEGITVVESKILGEIIRKLPNEEVKFQKEDNNIFSIECEGSLYKLSIMNYEDFPNLPEVVPEESVIVNQKTLKEMIKQTIFSISTDENRPIFTGCLLEVDENNINMVSVDGFRLSLRKKEYKSENKGFKAIIPGKTLNEIFKIIHLSEDNIIINIAKNQALFEIEGVKIVSRLMEGEFLNYKSAVPVEKETRVRIKKDTLLSAFERIYILTKDEKKYPVKMRINNNNLNITCNSTVGTAKEDIMVEIEGKDIEIGFNPKYFIEALKVIEEQEINIDFTTGMAPAVIRPIEGEEYTYMILPVRIREENA